MERQQAQKEMIEDLSQEVDLQFVDIDTSSGIDSKEGKTCT